MNRDLFADVAAGLKQALIQQDMRVLESKLLLHGLPEVCSFDFLDYCRSSREGELVLLLATLGADNSVNASYCELILSLYQSRAHSQPVGAIGKLSADHPLRWAHAVVNQRLTGAAENASTTQRCKGLVPEVALAVEFLIDHDCSEAAASLAIAHWRASSNPEDQLPVLRSMVSRFDVRSPTRGECKALLPAVTIIHGDLSRRHAQPTISDSVALLAAQLAAGADELHESLRWVGRVRFGMARLKACFLAVELCCRLKRPEQAVHEMDAVLESALRLGLESTRRVLNAPGGNKPGIEKAFNLRSARQALADFQQALQVSGLFPFLVSGTLLGYARLGTFLPHDKDVDLGLLHEDGLEPIANTLEASGYFRVELEATDESEFNLMAIHQATGVAIDVFLFRRVGSRLVTGVRSSLGYLQTFAFTPFKLKSAQFAGLDTWVPDDVDMYLCENYGDWRTPLPAYLPHVEAPAILEPGGPIHRLVARLELLYALLKGSSERVSRLMKFFEAREGEAMAMSPVVVKLLNAYLLAHSSEHLLEPSV